MSTKKNILMGAAATTVGMAMFAGVAAAQTPASTGNHATLVDKIAQKFNLNKDEVQKVFDEDKTSHEAARTGKLTARLDQAVKDGKITEVQKTANLQKMQEMRDYNDSIKDKTRDERKQLMKAKMDEIKAWADAQGLSDYLPAGPKDHGMRDDAGKPNTEEQTETQ